MILLILLALLIIGLNNSLSSKTKLFSMSLILVLLITFSFGYGTDYFHYEYIYTHFDPIDYSLSKTVEFGFQLLMVPFKILKLDFKVFHAALSLGILFIFTKWIKDSSETPAMALLLYFAMFFTIWNVSVLRQGIALAKGVYLFFNPKVKLNLWQQLLAVCILSLFHISALMLIPVILLSKYKWNQKKHLILVGFGLVMTFLPLEKMLTPFSGISVIQSVIKYIEPNFGFFDFPSLVRLFFFALVLFFYDKLSQKRDIKKITDAFLYGVSFYFILKFSELAASRFTIYTFILLVVLLPEIYHFFDAQVFKKYRLREIGLALFCTLFLIKDFNAYKQQVGYQSNLSRFGVHSIFNQDYSDFNNIHAFRMGTLKSQIQSLQEFQKKEIGFEPDYDDELDYFAIRDPESGKVGILNSQGNWYLEPQFNDYPIVYGNVMVRNKTQHILVNPSYTDLSDQKRSQDEMRRYVDQLMADYNKDMIVSDTKTGLAFEDVIQDSTSVIPFANRLGKTSLSKVIQGELEYHVLYMEYYHYRYYLYFDQDLNLYSTQLAERTAKYNHNNILKLETEGSSLFFNRSGELIWMEK